MAHIEEIEEQEEIVSTHIESLHGDRDSDSTACTPNMGTKMYSTPTKVQIVDLYAVGSEEPEEFEINPLPEVPFVHSITLRGTEGRIVCVRGMFDSGAMVNTMCSSIYETIKH